jgi:nitrogen regulatory protein PII
MALFEIKNIAANPFRHIERYPIRKEKVAALRESLQKTGFWDNVVARVRNGKAEIAYGHHRLFALKEEYGPTHKVDLIIKDLDDETMLQIMARENMEEWGSSAVVEQETVRAVVEAYADGLIELLNVPKNTDINLIRYAPSFIRGEPSAATREVRYTATTVAAFLGWDLQKVKDALSALELIEDGILKESDFDGLNTSQARAVLEQARTARRRRDTTAEVHRQQAESAKKDAAKAENESERQRALLRERKAREKAEQFKIEGRQKATVVGRAVSSSLKKGEISYKQARDVANRVDARKKEPPPDIDRFAERLTTQLNLILDRRDDHAVKLDELVRFRKDLAERRRHNLVAVLERISERALNYARQFSEKPAEKSARVQRTLLTKGGQ